MQPVQPHAARQPTAMPSSHAADSGMRVELGRDGMVVSATLHTLKDIERLIQILSLNKILFQEVDDQRDDVNVKHPPQQRATNSDNAKLRASGYTSEQIDEMGSVEAKRVADKLESGK
jgi:hypothetical protein